MRTVQDETSLKSTVTDMLKITPVLLQTFFPGIGIGQEFLVSDGRLIDAFQHERIHEPLGGGGSSYRKSVEVDERILDASRRLLSHLRWTGVAMVEYRWNSTTGDFVLMEINGRFWGSLPLAVAAGVDFPYRLYRLLLERPLSPARPYRRNLCCRNLTKDLQWFKERRRGTANNSSASSSLVAEVFAGVRNSLSGRERRIRSPWMIQFPA